MNLFGLAIPILCPIRLAFSTVLFVLLPSIAPAQEILSWSSEGPVTRVHGAEETWLMPTGAVQVAQQRLPLPPRDWYRRVFPRQQHVRLGARGIRVNFVVEHGLWHLLTDQSITYLNEIMQPKARDLGGPSLDNAEKLISYLDALDEVTLNPRIIMDDRFARGALDRAGREVWLEGREKRPSALRRLCHPLAITRRGTEATITYHEMLLDGSVVQRTVHAQTGGPQLKLVRLEAVQIRPAGTFSYDPPLGDY